MPIQKNHYLRDKGPFPRYGHIMCILYTLYTKQKTGFHEINDITSLPTLFRHNKFAPEYYCLMLFLLTWSVSEMASGSCLSNMYNVVKLECCYNFVNQIPSLLD